MQRIIGRIHAIVNADNNKQLKLIEAKKESTPL